MGDYIGAAARAFVTALMLLAGLILLAACANPGSLFAARAAQTDHASVATMIALAGGAVGLAVSVPLLHRLGSWQRVPDFPVNMPVNPDAKVYSP